MTDKIKNGIIIESQNVLTSYIGKPIYPFLLKNIQDDLQKVLNAFLTENEVYGRHFPITFENELGTWEIYETGKVLFRHKNDIESITCNITVTKTNNMEELKDAKYLGAFTTAPVGKDGDYYFNNTDERMYMFSNEMWMQLSLLEDMSDAIRKYSNDTDLGRYVRNKKI